MRLIENRHGRDPAASLAAAKRLFSREARAETAAAITGWADYQPTPLVSLSGVARAVGVRSVWYKDESSRFGLGSFKALGGAYAVFNYLSKAVAERTGASATPQEIESGAHADITSNITVASATAGNHGCSVAWGARRFYCRCVIFVAEDVSKSRRTAIARHGAEIRVVPGNYDDSVREAARVAAENGWTIISDTSYAGYTQIPREVMLGYTVMIEEAIGQIPRAEKPTHVFAQSGVGGMAAAACATLWDHYGVNRPVFVTVEPENAACLFQSALRGQRTTLTGSFDTIMGGLRCGEVSPLAWEILERGADFFLTIPDDIALDAMRLLAQRRHGDQRLVAGESGVAGLAALYGTRENGEMAHQLGLGPASNVLLFGTEGATDPEIYANIVGQSEMNS